MASENPDMSLVFKKIVGVHQKNHDFVFQFSSELDSQFLNLQKDKVAHWLGQNFWKGVNWSVVIAEEAPTIVPVQKTEDKKIEPLDMQVKIFKTVFRGEIVPAKEEKS